MMSTSTVIHSINALLDWLTQQSKTPEHDRMTTALNELKTEAVNKLASEISD